MIVELDADRDDPVTAAELGDLLVGFRLARGISQEKLAELVAVPRYQIDHWESGHGLGRSVKLFAAFDAVGSTVKIVPRDELRRVLYGRSWPKRLTR